VGNPNNASDAQGLRLNVNGHPVTRKVPALTHSYFKKLLCGGHAAAMSMLWKDWFSGGRLIFRKMGKGSLVDFSLLKAKLILLKQLFWHGPRACFNAE
jgi:hypothetical protein